MATRFCPECGAPLADADSCESYFHQMLFWEAEFPEIGVVHHLMVLCFHLQHPSRYSSEGLKYSMRLLHQFVAEGLTPQQVRHDSRHKVDSGKRNWTVTPRDGVHGVYEHPVTWSLTAADVIAGGPDGYIDGVKAWATAAYETLKSTHNL